MPLLSATKKLSPADLVDVGFYDAEVILDKTSLSKLPEGKQTSEEGLTAPTEEFGADECSVGLTRAILVAQIQELMVGKSGAKQATVQYLSELLNHQITPRLPLSNALGHLTHYFNTPEGLTCTYEGKIQPFGEVIAAKNITIPHLPAGERKGFSNLKPQAVLLALSTHASSLLMDAVDVTAALSCEAMKLSVVTFGSSYHDTSRPHRFQVHVAKTLLSLLDGSDQIEFKKFKPAQIDAFKHLPEFHGPLRETLASTVKTVKIELNSVAPSVRDPFHVQPLLNSAVAIVECLLIIASGSLQRAQAVAASVEGIYTHIYTLSST